jgi:hypothetical protein
MFPAAREHEQRGHRRHLLVDAPRRSGGTAECRRIAAEDDDRHPTGVRAQTHRRVDHVS